NVLRAPVISFTAPDNVPAEVIHRNDLRWNRGIFLRYPHNLPLSVIFYHLQIARIVEGPNSRGIFELGADNRAIFAFMQTASVYALKLRISAQAAVTSRQVFCKSLQVNVT